MGARGEVFSTKIQLPNRTYFFNVKENRFGDIYLNLVESKNKESGGFERQSIVVFADDTQQFLNGFDEALRNMERVVREQRKQHRSRQPNTSDQPGSSDKPNRRVIRISKPPREPPKENN
jgi:hypothetical protein